jgi:hypothetical protein
MTNQPLVAKTCYPWAARVYLLWEANGDELGSQRASGQTHVRKRSAGQSDIGRQLQEPAPVKIAVYRRALASVAAVGAVAGGLIGYWTVWKTVRTEVFREGQETQRTKPSRNAGGQST